MLLEKIVSLEETDTPLTPAGLPEPVPGPGQVLVRVSACGVCHTELDEIEGRTPPPRLPVVPGHQVVGTVVAHGPGTDLPLGTRVGAAWIFSACGQCEHCLAGDENLCAAFRATGRDAHGGYAEYLSVPQDFVHPIPAVFSDAEAAPLLCAGAIGYRSLRLANLQDGQALGLTGFGASAHLVLMLVKHQYPGARIHVFSRSAGEREFARSLGADWAGAIGASPPELLHAVIDTTPAWKPAVEALACLRPGGRLVVNAIRKQAGDQAALLELEYPRHLWMEKEIKSVANVARRDVREFLQIAARAGLRPEVQQYRLEDANTALMELKRRKIRGAKVLLLT